MTIHKVTIVGPHQQQTKLLRSLESNQYLRPVRASAVSGTSTSIRVVLGRSGGEAVQMFLDTVKAHDVSSIEAVSIATIRGPEDPTQYGVHRPAAEGWAGVEQVIMAPDDWPQEPNVRLRLSTPTDNLLRVLDALAKHFKDVTGRPFPRHPSTETCSTEPRGTTSIVVNLPRCGVANAEEIGRRMRSVEMVHHVDLAVEVPLRRSEIIRQDD